MELEISLKDLFIKCRDTDLYNVRKKLEEELDLSAKDIVLALNNDQAVKIYTESVFYDQLGSELEFIELRKITLNEIPHIKACIQTFNLNLKPMIKEQVALQEYKSAIERYMKFLFPKLDHKTTTQKIVENNLHNPMYIPEYNILVELTIKIFAYFDQIIELTLLDAFEQ
ncbi:MAG: hypothetical protein ACRC0X_02140 [Brevinema sp.]